MKGHQANNFWLFLVGMWSLTQVHFLGSIGISELFMFLAAPILFIVDFNKLKHDGFLPLIWLSILTCCGSVLAGVMNPTSWLNTLKGLAAPYAVFAEVVFFHRLLRHNFSGLKYLVMGFFLSGIICIFVFQPEVFTSRTGARTLEEARDAVTAYSLFWSRKVVSGINLPIQCCYFAMPKFFLVGSQLLAAGIFLIMSHGSGRSAAVAAIGSFILLLVAGKSRKAIRKAGKCFLLWFIGAIAILYLFKTVYSHLAVTGALGEEAQKKYENQTRGGTNVLRMLMSGRSEFFCGAYVCLHHPIFGLGNNAVDNEGLVHDFMATYASPDDYAGYLLTKQYLENFGVSGYEFVPAHSHIVAFWAYHGIFGLLLWLYVLYLCYAYVRRYACAIPQWYGYLAVTIPVSIWDIFFSPFGSRTWQTLMITSLLFARAVYNQKLSLPFDMEREARRYD